MAIAAAVPTNMPSMFLRIERAPATATPEAPVSRPGAFFPEPGLRAIVEFNLFIGGQAFQHDRYTRCRPFNVDEIVQVEADRQREFVKQ